VWYEVEGLELPKHFDLVVCDGPAVFEHWGESHLLWRYGVLPVLQARGVSVGEVLLDDASEPRGQNLLDRWQRDFGMAHRMVQTADGDYAVCNRTA
jgi:uncharacterized protein involved in type VI secretion and phage assembly